MPTYTFLDKRTGEEYDEVMMIAEMEKHKRKKHIELLLPTGINTMTMTECGRYKKQDVHTTRPDRYETITQTPQGTSWDTFERPNGNNNPAEPFVKSDGKIDMNECFYCFDCQEEYYDEHRCPPLVIKRKILTLPINQFLSSKQIKNICVEIKNFYKCL